MIIEIRMAGFVNKGAELMLYATLTKLKERYPDATFVMEPTLNDGPQPFGKLAQAGFYPKGTFKKFRIQWGFVIGMIPKKVRERYGIILDREVDIVVDAAGFAYSDQWGPYASVDLAESTKRWKKNGTKVVMLPQALGPFTSPKISDAMKVIVDNIGLIFPREKISFKYLTDIVGQRSNIIKRPDFTNLLSGIVPDDFDMENNKFCIVPNYRMVDKTSAKDSDAYLPFLINCAKHLVEKDAKPFILVHEGDKDLELAQRLSAAVGNIPIVIEDDALKIKGILGSCSGTIGSRFHGLVSALSQGVPSLATGWSHKYQMLFEDYGFPEGLVDVKISNKEVIDKIDLILKADSREKIVNTIIENSNLLKEESRQMWATVFDYLEK
ncbi:colanic acid biosynthesis protein [Serratia proteamaculans]|uniref:polysaccharide pyruvyl transferase family protein n=1 Tax=Serratia proteamaculans TaxID=28151 RepID=UPI00102124A1|nr:polysaccharide pyruvyl transferase family protein [Serratia proteamaculans]RYM51467.1 hypothetical protein BSQ97_11915 [Serratia proteamaculans]RYM56675.1 hypothetical protein BSQ96_08305 [Serratia proteamaculans]CAI2443717.1 colanic acid biosynthesis protein [Serratia proteamaculans]